MSTVIEARDASITVASKRGIPLWMIIGAITVAMGSAVAIIAVISVRKSGRIVASTVSTTSHTPKTTRVDISNPQEFFTFIANSDESTRVDFVAGKQFESLPKEKYDHVTREYFDLVQGLINDQEFKGLNLKGKGTAEVASALRTIKGRRAVQDAVAKLPEEIKLQICPVEGSEKGKACEAAKETWKKLFPAGLSVENFPRKEFAVSELKKAYGVGATICTNDEYFSRAFGLVLKEEFDSMVKSTKPSSHLSDLYDRIRGFLPDASNAAFVDFAAYKASIEPPLAPKNINSATVVDSYIKTVLDMSKTEAECTSIVAVFLDSEIGGVDSFVDTNRLVTATARTEADVKRAFLMNKKAELAEGMERNFVMLYKKSAEEFDKFVIRSKYIRDVVGAEFSTDSSFKLLAAAVANDAESKKYLCSVFEYEEKIETAMAKIAKEIDEGASIVASVDTVNKIIKEHGAEAMADIGRWKGKIAEAEVKAKFVQLQRIKAEDVLTEVVGEIEKELAKSDPAIRAIISSRIAQYQKYALLVNSSISLTEAKSSLTEWLVDSLIDRFVTTWFVNWDESTRLAYEETLMVKIKNLIKDANEFEGTKVTDVFGTLTQTSSFKDAFHQITGERVDGMSNALIGSLNSIEVDASLKEYFKMNIRSHIHFKALFDASKSGPPQSTEFERFFECYTSWQYVKLNPSVSLANEIKIAFDYIIDSGLSSNRSYNAWGKDLGKIREFVALLKDDAFTADTLYNYSVHKVLEWMKKKNDFILDSDANEELIAKDSNLKIDQFFNIYRAYSSLYKISKNASLSTCAAATAAIAKIASPLDADVTKYVSDCIAGIRVITEDELCAAQKVAEMQLEFALAVSNSPGLFGKQHDSRDSSAISSLKKAVAIVRIARVCLTGRRGEVLATVLRDMSLSEARGAFISDLCAIDSSINVNIAHYYQDELQAFKILNGARSSIVEKLSLKLADPGTIAEVSADDYRVRFDHFIAYKAVVGSMDGDKITFDASKRMKKAAVLPKMSAGATAVFDGFVKEIEGMLGRATPPPPTSSDELMAELSKDGSALKNLEAAAKNFENSEIERISSILHANGVTADMLPK